MIKYDPHSISIPETCANMRVDQALARCLPQYSRMQIKAWIKTGSLTINHHNLKPNLKVKGGEIVTLKVVEQKTDTWEAEAIPLDIIYEDDDILVINKNAGLIAHPGAGHQRGTLLNALLHHAKELHHLPRAGIIHRLDKETTGLLVIGKTPIAIQSLTNQLKKRTLLREYQALVYGILISGGKINAPIGRHSKIRTQMAVNALGKPAITHYRIIEKYRNITRLRLRLETGRTHQIRVHMQHCHHPLVGDLPYGGRIRGTKGMLLPLIDYLRQFKRQALHAEKLGLHHPVTGKWIEWKAPLPDDLNQLITLLKADLQEMRGA